MKGLGNKQTKKIIRDLLLWKDTHLGTDCIGRRRLKGRRLTNEPFLINVCIGHIVGSDNTFQCPFAITALDWPPTINKSIPLRDHRHNNYCAQIESQCIVVSGFRMGLNWKHPQCWICFGGMGLPHDYPLGFYISKELALYKRIPLPWQSLELDIGFQYIPKHCHYTRPLHPSHQPSAFDRFSQRCAKLSGFINIRICCGRWWWIGPVPRWRKLEDERLTCWKDIATRIWAASV